MLPPHPQPLIPHPATLARLPPLRPTLAVRLFTCRFFDRGGSGYLRTDDLKRILHAVGLQLPHRAVKALVAAAAAGGGGAGSDRVHYRALCDLPAEEAASSAQATEKPAAAAATAPTAAAAPAAPAADAPAPVAGTIAREYPLAAGGPAPVADAPSGPAQAEAAANEAAAKEAAAKEAAANETVAKEA
eukprot:63723-Chlamydomonas_euryale.AAC.1